MSEEQVEIVGRFAEVTNPKDAMADEEAVEAFRRDLEKMTHPDFHTLSAGVLPDTEGLDGFLAVWLEWLDTWRTLTIETEEIRDLGDDRVLALTVARGRTMTGDVPLDARGGTIFTFRDAASSGSTAYSRCGKMPSKPPGCRSTTSVEPDVRRRPNASEQTLVPGS